MLFVILFSVFWRETPDHVDDDDDDDEGDVS